MKKQARAMTSGTHSVYRHQRHKRKWFCLIAAVRGHAASVLDTIALLKTRKGVRHKCETAAINLCNIATDTTQVLTCAYLLTPAYSARVLRPPTGAPDQGVPFRPPLEARPPPLPCDLRPIVTEPKLVLLSSSFTRTADRYCHNNRLLLEPRVQNPSDFSHSGFSALLLEQDNSRGKLTGMLSRRRDKALNQFGKVQ